eukprot:Gb_35861 [translate_table: standard]
MAIEKVVFNIEDKQTYVNNAMEQFQASTFHLETCESPKKKQILSLYKDVEGIVERLQQVQDLGHTTRLKSVKGGEGIVRSGDTKRREPLRHLDKGLDTLENKIEHVASIAYMNLSILDAKVESVCIGGQTATKGATTVESKCNALRTKLVRFFRTLAASSKERPGKLHGCGRHMDSCVATQCQMLRHNEGPNICDPTTLDSALVIVAKKRSKEMASMILVHDIDVNRKNVLGDIALHWATGHGDEEIVALLLHNGTDSEAREV